MPPVRPPRPNNPGRQATLPDHQSPAELERRRAIALLLTMGAVAAVPAMVSLVRFGRFSVGNTFNCKPPTDEMIKKFGLKNGVYDEKSCNYLLGSKNKRAYEMTKEQDIAPLITNADGMGHRISADADVFCKMDDEDCLQDFRIYLREDFRDKVVAAADEFYETYGEALKINFGLRTNERQIIASDKRRDKAFLKNIYKRLRAVVTRLGPAAPPGTSFHETGLAIDVSGSQIKRFTPIAAKHGIDCGFIKKDAIHCSVIEKGMM